MTEWWQARWQDANERINFEREIYGNLVGEWLLALGIAIVAWIVLRLAKAIVQSRASSIGERRNSNLARGVAELLAATRWWFLIIAALYIGTLALEFNDKTRGIIQSAAIITLLLQAGIWGNVAVTQAITRYVERRMETDAASVTTVMALGFLGKLALWAVVVLLILDNVGVQVTALIAGLGVGGIAVALAAQNILGDLFASLSIVLDKPFVLGDFIIVGDFLGTVEHIGMKTTRLRSLSGEQLVFTNSDLLQSRIRNFKRMYERRILFTIGVTYQTPHAELQAIPGLIRTAVEACENTRFDRAHFRSFGDSALIFEVVYYVTVPDYGVYMDIQQQVNLDLVATFAERGIEFAYPTQTIFLQQEEPVAPGGEG